LYGNPVGAGGSDVPGAESDTSADALSKGYVWYQSRNRDSGSGTSAGRNSWDLDLLLPTSETLQPRLLEKG